KKPETDLNRLELLRGASPIMTTPGGTADGSSKSELPDIDVDSDLKQLAGQRHEIDQQLEQIGHGVTNLKEIAINMGSELDHQNQIITDIDGKVERAAATLDTLNVKMKKTVEGVMSGDKFLVNCILITLALALAAFIASYFIS